MAEAGNDSFELAIERRIAVPPALLWRVWTEHLAEWWCPRPWRTEVRAFDMQPGGAFETILSGPDGESHANDGVFLEVVPERRLVTTDAFTVGWVPKTPFMVGVWDFVADGDATLYRAAARHWDAEAMQRHEAMGFAHGWGAVTDQLAALAEGMG